MSVGKKLVFLGNKKVTPAVTPGLAAGNGLAIDRLGFDTAIFNLAVATMTSATSKVTIQHSDTNQTGDFTNYQPKGVDVESETLTETNTNTSLIVDLSGAKRYVRVVVAETGTVSAFNVTAVLDDGDYSEDFEDPNQYVG